MPVKKSMDTISKSATEPAPASASPTPATTPIIVPPASLTPSASTPSNTDTFESMFPEPSVVIEGPPSWVWWLVLFVASSVVAVVGYQLVSTRLAVWAQKNESTSPTPTTQINAITASATPVEASPPVTAAPSPVAVSSPTPSQAAVTPAAQVRLRVLNGTTIAGAAGRAVTALEKAGYTSRSSGNARNQTYTQTIIYYIPGKVSEAEQVAAALSTYNPTLQESQSLADPDDVLVVVAQ